MLPATTAEALAPSAGTLASAEFLCSPKRSPACARLAVGADFSSNIGTYDETPC